MAVNGSHSGGSGDSLWKPRVKKTWAINYSACHSARKWCSSGESFSGVLSHRDDGVFSGLVCGDYFDLDSWGVTWEDELSCVQMLFVPLWVTFSYTVTAFCNKNFHV